VRGVRRWPRVFLLVVTGMAVGATALPSFDVGRVARAQGPHRRPALSFGLSAKYLVLIVLDGGRPDYFGLTPLPHVDALRAAGTQYTRAFDGILETETPAGHTTLSTGSTPRRNGILGFNWAQNDNDYSLFSQGVVRSGAIERIMQSTGVPTLAGLFKARHPKEKVVALSGHKYYAADPLGGPSADAIMYFRGEVKGGYGPTAIPGHVPPPGVLDSPGLSLPTFHLAYGKDDSLATQLGLAAFVTMRPHMLLINYPEFDWPLGHVYGGNTNRPKAIALMQRFDYDLGLIEDAYHRAHILRKTLFVVTADHGMAPTWRFAPDTVIKNAVIRAHAVAPVISYSGGAYIWLRKVAQAQAVAQNILAARDPGIQSAYYLSAAGGKEHYVPAGGRFATTTVNSANLYLLGTLLDGHQPAVVAFATNHATFARPTTHWKADHGGGGWQSQHIPLILAGPGIRGGVVTAQPAQLIDVAPTVLTDMGVAPTGMEGHVLTEALGGAAPPAQQQRATEAGQIGPVVDALIAQDRYESAHRSSATVNGTQEGSLRRQG